MKIRRLAVAGVAILALALTACAGGGNRDNSGGGEGGGQLVIDTAFDLTTLDPQRMNEPSGIRILRGVYETALRFTSADAGSIEPWLADYEMSADDKVLTLTVKEGPKWSDGSPITADDMVFSYQRLIGLKGNPATNLSNVTVEKVSDTQLTLTSSVPAPQLPVTMANPSLGIIQKSVAEENGATTDAATDKAEGFFNKQSIGSGPYKIEKADMASQVSLVPNPDYWGEPAKLDRMIFRNVAAATQAINIKAGTAHIVDGLSGEQGAGVGGDLKVINEASNQTIYVLMNQNPAVNKWTSNPDFLSAIRMGINYDTLLAIAGPGSVRASGVLPPMIPGSLPESEAPKTDIEGAKAALAASGYAGEEIQFDVANDMVVRGVSLLTVAESIQDQLSNIGVNLKLNPQPITTALDPYRAGEQGMALWYVQPSQPHNFEGLNYGPDDQMGKRAGWTAADAPEVVALMTEIREAAEADRVPLFQDFGRILNESGPYISLLLPPTTIVTAANVEGLVLLPSGDFDITFLSLKK